MDKNPRRISYAAKRCHAVRLANPAAFGAFEGSNLLGFVEGFLEKWNNRFRITNICILDPSARRAGLGKMLLERILIDAEKSGARMIVLETQSFNSAAISFYQKNGFEIIGFDRFAYSNEGPSEHNMRIEMGKNYSKFLFAAKAIQDNESQSN